MARRYDSSTTTFSPEGKLAVRRWEATDGRTIDIQNVAAMQAGCTKLSTPLRRSTTRARASAFCALMASCWPVRGARACAIDGVSCAHELQRDGSSLRCSKPYRREAKGDQAARAVQEQREDVQNRRPHGVHRRRCACPTGSDATISSVVVPAEGRERTAQVPWRRLIL